MNVIVRNYVIKIDHFLKEIEAITDNECFYNNKEYLTASLIDAVHAIADCYERNKDKLDGTDKEYVLAFCYLNNQLKHDRWLEVFSTPIYCAIFPIRFPFRLGATSCSIVWADFENHGKDWAEAKRYHYDRYLKQNDVKETLLNVKLILDNVVEK